MLPFQTVNDAFEYMVRWFDEEDASIIKEDTRNGPVLRLEYPVTWRFNFPCKRVLFNSSRDCNPFFHMYEAMWMLSGRNDVASVAHYCKQMLEYSDDGTTIHDAYGYRWRNWFNIDQLDYLVDIIKKDPTTRRAVLQMWDCRHDLTLLRFKPACKALPCNTHVYFHSDGRYLSMTVCNRSNDLLWGAFGANAVHFSFLLEYMARRCKMEVGHMTTFCNNLHIYEKYWQPEKWLEDTTPIVEGTIPFDAEDEDLVLFTEFPTEQNTSKFLNGTAVPMMRAWESHKRRDYEGAIGWAEMVEADDWKAVSCNWMTKRRNLYEKDGPNYE